MAPGPRDYGTGTERALFRVAHGTCYFPECAVPVVSVERGHHVVGVEIAHIRGANAGSPRYDLSQTDDDRRAFSNLILLCNKHHKLVDKIDPGSYPVEMLQGWKADNEDEAGGRMLAMTISESDLEELLRDTFAASPPRRIVEVEVLGGIVINSTEVLAWDLEDLELLLAENPAFWTQPRVVIADIRNVGSVDVSIEQVDFSLGVETAGSRSETLLTGRNDFGESNPHLPYRLASGDAVRWFTALNTFEMIAMGLRGASGEASEITDLTGRVRLATGERVVSSPTAWKLSAKKPPL